MENMKQLRRLLISVVCMAMLCLAAAELAPTPAAATAPIPGLVPFQSDFSVAETGDRLEAALAERDLNVFARIDHAANADSVDLELRDTELVIFGNPNVGTQLMQCNQSAAIDLPQKMLIWEDETGQTWLAYNSPIYLLERHALSDCEPVINRIGEVLEGIAQETIQAS
ncbi:MAG: DUF302 domain-containing protein [Leptolyngbyaceae cyanobacterium]